MSKSILIIGGNGFIGKNIKSVLKSYGYTTYTMSRRSDNTVKHIQGDILDTQSIADAIEISKPFAVVNCVGLTPIFKPRHVSYEQIHYTGVCNIVNTIKQTKINRRPKLIHLSACGADVSSDIEYLRTKGLGENYIGSNLDKFTIIRPSIVSGEGSEIYESLNKVRIFRILPTPRLTSLVQPALASEIGELVHQSLFDNNSQIIYPGKEKMPMYIFLQTTMRDIGIRSVLFPQRILVALLSIATLLNITPLSNDIVELLKRDNIPDATQHLDKIH